MASHRIRLCDACHKRPATYHLHEIADGRTKSTDLCNGCFEAREPRELKESRKAAEAAHCEYCGTGPCVDWHLLTNILAFIAEPERRRFLCARCSTEYNRFIEQKMEEIPSGLSETEQSARFDTLRTAAHEHMLSWVARGKS